MTEEQVTKALLKWLIDDGWTIICYDFPQSGTGRLLHPNNSSCFKNLNSINPDIVAVKEPIALFFENKDRFYYSDYIKQNTLIEENDYTEAISDLLSGYKVDSIYYGIGLPLSAHKKKSQDSSHLVDFIVTVDNNKCVETAHNPKHIPMPDSI